MIGELPTYVRKKSVFTGRPSNDNDSTLQSLIHKTKLNMHGHAYNMHLDFHFTLTLLQKMDRPSITSSSDYTII